MYKAKAHLQLGQDIVGTERWQWQPQQQSHIPFQHLGTSEDSICVSTKLIWRDHVGENTITVIKPGYKHDQFAVAVVKDETCTVGDTIR